MGAHLNEVMVFKSNRYHALFQARTTQFFKGFINGAIQLVSILRLNFLRSLTVSLRVAETN